MLSSEATNTNFIVFGLIRPGLEPTFYRTRGEHANHYATDAVSAIYVLHTYKILDRKLIDQMIYLCLTPVLFFCVFYLLPTM